MHKKFLQAVLATLDTIDDLLYLLTGEGQDPVGVWPAYIIEEVEDE